MLLGINTNPVQGFTVQQQVDLLGAGGLVRTAPWQDVDYDYNKWAQELQANQLEPVYVLDLRALSGINSSRGYYAAMRKLRSKYPTVKYWQIGNEEDQPNSASSWYMPPGRFESLLLNARLAFGDSYLIAGALVSGDIGYVEQVKSWPVNAIAFHPYGIRPTNWQDPNYGFGAIENTYAMYSGALPDLDIWITELGNDMEPEHTRAAYHSEMLTSLLALGAKTALVFCYSDVMVAGYGLCDSAGDAKETYAAVANWGPR